MRSLVMPLDAEYRWFFGFWAASISLSTMCWGVPWSGLPMPRSMISSPLLRASIFIAFTMAKTYGGSRLILPKSSPIIFPFPFEQTAASNRAIFRVKLIIKQYVGFVNKKYCRGVANQFPFDFRGYLCYVDRMITS